MEEYRVTGSGVISGAIYKADTGSMTIILHSGKSYSYSGIDKDVWEGFKMAESKGKFYSMFIKGKYSRE